MPDTVHIPLLGNTNKGVALAGGLAVVATGGYLLYKNYKKNKTATTTPAAGSTYGYGAYAYGYGAYGYGSNPAYGYGGYTYEPSPYYGYGDVGGSGGSVYGYGSTPITSNSQWITAAENALASQGYLPATVQAALGVYLAGGTLTAQQSQIVQAAIAAVGQPPSPPSTTSTGANTGQNSGQPTGTATGTTGTSATNTVAVPNVVGYTAGAAHNAIDGIGLHAVAPPGQKATWIVSGTQPEAGQQVPLGGSVLINAAAKS